MECRHRLRTMPVLRAVGVVNFRSLTSAARDVIGHTHVILLQRWVLSALSIIFSAWRMHEKFWQKSGEDSTECMLYLCASLHFL
jgi:hypothetical protein